VNDKTVPLTGKRKRPGYGSMQIKVFLKITGSRIK
jgi:hypothetical protein